MRAIRSMASAGRSVNSSSGRRTFSRSVIEPNSAPLWYITPILRRMRVRSSPSALVMSSPSIRMCPGRRPVEADHVLEQRALAAAGAAEDHEHLAPVDLEGDVVDDDVVAVGRGEILHADDGFGGHARACSDPQEIVDERRRCRRDAHQDDAADPRRAWWKPDRAGAVRVCRPRRQPMPATRMPKTEALASPPIRS